MSSKALAPGLLLATPKLAEGIFHKSVVLLANHGEDGALGWVVNGQPLAPLVSLLRDSGLTPPGVTLPDTDSYRRNVRVGGPVSPRSAWVLYRSHPKWEHDAEIKVSEHWAASGDRSIVEAIARGEGPEEFRLILGYSGWAPGQLDNEIAHGMWMPVEVDEQVVFGDLADEQMWLKAYDSCLGVSPYAFIVRGNPVA